MLCAAILPVSAYLSKALSIFLVIKVFMLQVALVYDIILLALKYNAHTKCSRTQCLPPCLPVKTMLLDAEMLIRKGTSKLRRELLVGFDPVSMLIAQIQQRFQGAASFFVDLYGGDVLALKWHERTFVPVPFDAAKAYMLEPHNHGTGNSSHVQHCIVSVSAVVSDIRLLGAGLVQEVLLAS